MLEVTTQYLAAASVVQIRNCTFPRIMIKLLRWLKRTISRKSFSSNVEEDSVPLLRDGHLVQEVEEKEPEMQVHSWTEEKEGEPTRRSLTRQGATKGPERRYSSTEAESPRMPSPDRTRRTSKEQGSETPRPEWLDEVGLGGKESEKPHAEESKTAQPGPESFESSLATTFVPADVLLCITDCLDSIDAACLSLCNRSTYQTLGVRKALRSATANQALRGTLMLRLTRDLPGHLFCPTCQRLHAIGRLQPPGRVCLVPQATLLPCERSAGTDYYFDHCFSSTLLPSLYKLRHYHVQSVLQTHRKGLQNGLSVGSLALTEVISYSSRPVLLSVEGAIIGGTLYLRVQQWLTDVQSRLSREASHGRMWWFSICAHINWIDMHTLPDFLQCKLQHAVPRPTCPTCFPLLKCSICAIEFSVEVHFLEEGRGITVSVSKWLNMGTGTSQETWLWKRHVKPSWAFSPAFRDLTKIQEADTEIGIRSLFEAATSKPLTELTAQNERLLRDNRYQRELMQLGTHTTWYTDWSGRDFRWKDPSSHDEPIWYFPYPGMLHPGWEISREEVLRT